ncbi:pyridoxal-phosphate dependent enzyme [Bacillus cereus]|nr:pyridoxal-phosphate dependent enzyme [Bacillus cereus]
MFNKHRLSHLKAYVVHRKGFGYKQVTGAFKFRGNIAKLSKLPRGLMVVTASRGNHANGLATAAKIFGHTASVFIPKNIPQKKLDRIKKAGTIPILVDGKRVI